VKVERFTSDSATLVTLANVQDLYTCSYIQPRRELKTEHIDDEPFIAGGVTGVDAAWVKKNGLVGWCMAAVNVEGRPVAVCRPVMASIASSV
jgi:hypothetical protein